MRRAGWRHESDRGSVSIWTLAVGLLVAFMGFTSVAVGQAVVATHRAQSAADLGAIAGAEFAAFGRDMACARAAQIVTANGATITSCVMDGLDIIVTARVDVSAGPVHGVTSASADAGPERA
jgi:secretion/DNA translocation related TadE-like protein